MSRRPADADDTPPAVAKTTKPRKVGRSGKVDAAVATDRVRVSDGALATIIGLAAHEVPGVVGMAPASFTEGLRRILGVAQVDEGVEIQRSPDDDAVSVILHVVVAYGVNIPAVSESVVERVGYASLTFAGVPVTEVKVHVAGVSRG